MNEIKALGGGLFEALAVAFRDEPDCDNEVFDELDHERLGLDSEPKFLPLHYQHGRDATIGRRRLARADYELIPKLGLKIRWRFEKPNDPYIRDISRLCSTGILAISSGSVFSEKRKLKDYTLVVRWPLHEVSLTPQACALSGRTKVSSVKSVETLDFVELKRLTTLSETELLREESQRQRHRVLGTLGEKCDGVSCCRECWLDQQRAQRENADATDRMIGAQRVARVDYEKLRDEAKIRLASLDHLGQEMERVIGEAQNAEQQRAQYNQSLWRRHAGNIHAAMSVREAMRRYDAR